MGTVILLSSFLCVFLVLGLIRIIYKLWWIPTRIQKFMASQGIKGPCYRLIHGNTQEISSMHKETRSRSLGLSHDILSYVQPHVHSWTNIYGILSSSLALVFFEFSLKFLHLGLPL